MGTASSKEPPTAPSKEPPAAPSKEPPAAPSKEPPAAPSKEPPAAPSKEPPAAPSKEPPAAPSKEPPAIGIDLGMNYTRVGVWRHGRVEIIENNVGNRETPSYVAFTPDELLIGESAKNQADENPTNTIFDIQRLIGRRFSDPIVQSAIKLWPFNVIKGAGDIPRIVVKYRGEEKQFLPEELSAMILLKMKEIAEGYLECSVQNAVITVPAYFNESQRRATKDAAEIAGLKVMCIMDEATAAAVAYVFEKFLEEKNVSVLVFDLGLRTLNVSVVNRNHGIFRVKAIVEDTHFGGEDFSDRLMDHFLKEIKWRRNKDISDDSRAIRRLRSACEQAKRVLSFQGQTTVQVYSLFEGNDFSSNISQALFEDLNMDLFEKCMVLVENCLEDAIMEKTNIDIVVLVGGSTRIPFVQHMLRKFFDGKELCNTICPEEVMTYGAAIQAKKKFSFLGYCKVPRPVISKESEKSVIKASTTKSLTRGGTSSKLEKGQSSRQHVGPEEFAIGIDFGTTKSSVAVLQRNSIKIIESEYNSRITCSCVAFTDTVRLIGDTVHKEQVIMNPEYTVPNIKRLIGRCYSDPSVQNDSNFLPFKIICGDKNRPMVSVQYKNEEKFFTPEEIAAMVLSKMKAIAEAHLKTKISSAVISVPACFSDSQRKAIKDAGVIAGLNVMQLLDEPTATTIAYYLQEVGVQNSSEKTLLLFDLGGGNLDVSIFTIKEGTIRVKAVAGDTSLGGEDFDNNLACHFVTMFAKGKKKDISNKRRCLRRLKAACAKAKIVLSNFMQTTIEIEALDDGIDFRTVITRQLFEELNIRLFTRCIGCVERCLVEAKIDKSCIDEVIVVGGSTKIPKLRQLIKDYFNGKELYDSMNLDDTVAYGAAVRAAMLCGIKDSKQFCGLKVEDVTSYSLWLEGMGGAMSLLIPKSTPIPMKREILFSTCSDDQMSMSIGIHKNKVSRAVFTLSKVPPNLIGNSEVRVTFEIDNNGFLNLTAESNEIIISRQNVGLTKEEIQMMIEAEASYRAVDEENKARASGLNSLESLAYKIKSIAMGPGVSSSSKKSVAKATDDAIAWLETNYDAAIGEINAWKKQLETIQSGIVYLGTNVSL